MGVVDPGSARRSRPERRHVEQVAEEIAAAAQRLRVDVPELEERARDWVDAGDGYPTASLRSGGSGGGTHGDPVANLVTARDTSRNSLRNAYLKASDHLIDALHAIRAAQSAVAATRPSQDEPAEQDDGCVSCARVGHFEKPRARGRCRWCQDHRQDDGEDPPLQELRRYVELRARRKRIP